MPWHVHTDGDSVLTTFVGRVSADEGDASARRFSESLSRTADAHVSFDVSDMTGHDPGADRQWRRALLRHRGKIRSVDLRGGHSLFGAGPTLVKIAVGAPVRCL